MSAIASGFEQARPAMAAVARLVTTTGDLPEAVSARVRTVILDGLGALLAATNPEFSTGRRITELVRQGRGAPQASVIGGGFRTSMIDAALANGTLGYACDIEPHHPEAILHPAAVVVPAALAVGEHVGASGRDLMLAVALGCEVEYRVSMALSPAEQYRLGFHPSAVCGAFGAAAAAGRLLALAPEAVERALGLAALQASGLMAWEADATENARPFQMGMAARNGVTAALLAALDFGAPRTVFDSGHTVFRAFSRAPRPDALTADLGQRWDGIMELAIKPYSCVAFLHPALDALAEMVREDGVSASCVESLVMRFAGTGVHCVDDNPLKSHSAQYVLAVALVTGRLEVADIFFDRRQSDPAIMALSRRITVVADNRLERLFPDAYATVLEARLRDGRLVRRRRDIARGYPEAPMSQAEIRDKFLALAGTVAPEETCRWIVDWVDSLERQPDVRPLCDVLRTPAAAPGAPA